MANAGLLISSVFGHLPAAGESVSNPKPKENSPTDRKANLQFFKMSIRFLATKQIKQGIEVQLEKLSSVDR